MLKTIQRLPKKIVSPIDKIILDKLRERIVHAFDPDQTRDADGKWAKEGSANDEPTKVGSQLGSNPGGVYQDKAGNKQYVKFYKNPDQGKVEVLAGKIYSEMEIHTLQPEITTIGGKQAVVTDWNPDLKSMSPKDFEHLNSKQQDQIGRMYQAAILTKNWDIVGLVHDNIMQSKASGDLYSIDTGGAFNFRAQGGPKEYGSDTNELQSLRNNPGNASSHVFNAVFKQNPKAEEAGVKAMRSLDSAKVAAIFKSSGLGNAGELQKNFEARRQALLEHYKLVKADGGINWTSPSGPVGQDWYDAYIGTTPIPHDHAPSLKNPIITKIPTAQDGWKQGDSLAKRKQAMQDLVELHKRMRRQIGKPEVAQTGSMPTDPHSVANVPVGSGLSGSAKKPSTK